MKARLVYVFVIIFCVHVAFASNPYWMMGCDAPCLDYEEESTNDLKFDVIVSDSIKAFMEYEGESRLFLIISERGDTLSKSPDDGYSMLMFMSQDAMASEMSGFSPYTYCMANPVSFIDPTGLFPTEQEAARMANYVYDEDVELIGGWSVVRNQTFTKTDENTGLKTMMFQRTKSDGSLEYVLAYAGTQFNDLTDAKNDVQQVFGQSAQYKQAIGLAKDFYDKYSGDRTFVGHSLGGGLSAVSAFATDGYAMTFNAAGVSYLTMLPNSSAKIDAYVTVSDPLNFLQFFTPLPRVDGNVHFRLPSSVLPWNGHSISNFHNQNFLQRARGVVRQGFNWYKGIIGR